MVKMRNWVIDYVHENPHKVRSRCMRERMGERERETGPEKIKVTQINSNQYLSGP